MQQHQLRELISKNQRRQLSARGTPPRRSWTSGITLRTILGFLVTASVRESARKCWSRARALIRAQAKDAYYRELTLDKRINYIHDTYWQKYGTSHKSIHLLMIAYVIWTYQSRGSYGRDKYSGPHVNLKQEEERGRLGPDQHECKGSCTVSAPHEDTMSRIGDGKIRMDTYLGSRVTEQQSTFQR